MPDQRISQEWPEDIIKGLRTRPTGDLKKKMRQVDLAQLVGVDSRTVQHWENGHQA